MEHPEHPVFPRAQLAVFAGLPGTGKTTLAEHAARVLGCPVDRNRAALERYLAS